MEPLPLKITINVTRTSGCHGMTALHQPTWAIGLPWHDSRIIHSRIANANIQALRIANSEKRV